MIPDDGLQLYLNMYLMTDWSSTFQMTDRSCFELMDQILAPSHSYQLSSSLSQDGLLSKLA